MSTREILAGILSGRIMILDGAMGSMIQTYLKDHGKALVRCNDLLTLSTPDVISSIHEAYLDAGADIIETCSLNATSVSLDDYGLGHKAREISRAAAAIARKAADKFSTPDKPRFVAGSIGPTAKSAAFTQDMDKPDKRAISWDELEAAFYENAKGLMEGGADILLIETVYDSLNAKAALFAINRLCNETGDIPVMVSATVTEAGRLITGQTPEAFCVSMLHCDPLALGLNCSFGADTLKASLEKLSFVPHPLCFYPNAGLPDDKGNYSDTPELMAKAAESCMKNGLINIIGGCCGSTPAHIRAIAKIAENYKPRIIPKSWTANPAKIILAGTRVIEHDFNYLSNPENLCTPLTFQNAIDQGSYDEAVEIAREEADRKQIKILAIAPDKAPDPVSVTRNLIFLAACFPDLSEFPVLIESSRWDVILAGLKCIHGRGLVKYNAPPDEYKSKENLIRSYGAVLIGASGVF